MEVRFIYFLMYLGLYVNSTNSRYHKAITYISPILRLRTLALSHGRYIRHLGQSTRRRRDDMQNEEVKILMEKGQHDSAILQFIELSISRFGQPCLRLSLARFKYQIPNQSLNLFNSQVTTAIRTANFLTNLFVKSKNESSLFQTLEIFYTLVRTNVESDVNIFSSGIAFRRGSFHPLANDPVLFWPFACRQADKVKSQDLAINTDLDYDNSSVEANEWFWRQSMKNFSEVFIRMFGADFQEKVGAALEGKADLLVGPEDGIWSSPYFDCEVGNTWIITYSSPFFGRSGDTVSFRGVVTVSFDLRNLNINQCANDGSPFAGTHKCNLLTTVCKPIPGIGFRRGGYQCHCKKGYFKLSEFDDSNVTIRNYENYFNGSLLERKFVERIIQHQNEDRQLFLEEFTCLPCKPGCESCEDGSPCYVEYNWILRSVALGLQTFCVTIVLLLAIVIFRLRKSRMVAAAMWVMLETILFGIILIYQTVIIRYFEPTTLRCLVEPWFREVGFAICYGAIMLKIYRIRAEFQTRKAHRVCVRDKDLLKYLLTMVFVVMGYMAAWSAIGIDNINAGYGILENGVTADGLKFVTCRAPWWDYVTEIGEFLFLVMGVYLTYCLRNAKPDFFREKWALCASVVLEMVVSLTMNITRHVIWHQLHPDYIFLLYFVRCQLTVTIVVILIFGPKIWYHRRSAGTTKPQRSRNFSSCEPQEQVPESLKLHEAIMSNGEIDFSDINLADMDPEDIRSELRRVYTQLQVLRNKTMRKDNPHISKRRGGRKVTHRRFSLQPFHHKHKQHHHHHHHHHHEPEPETTEISKTPEESTASMDGSTIQPDGPSTRGDE